MGEEKKENMDPILAGKTFFGLAFALDLSCRNRERDLNEEIFRTSIGE